MPGKREESGAAGSIRPILEAMGTSRNTPDPVLFRMPRDAWRLRAFPLRVPTTGPGFAGRQVDLFGLPFVDLPRARQAERIAAGLIERECRARTPSLDGCPFSSSR
jgi:hypothetical protein